MSSRPCGTITSTGGPRSSRWRKSLAAFTSARSGRTPCVSRAQTGTWSTPTTSGHLQESINSYWNLLVERVGDYEFALTRWPPEAGAALDVALTHPIGQGKALPIAKARLKIGDFDQSKPVIPGDKSVVFTVPLKAGRIRLQTWFYDPSGNELCGAFYVMAYRK